MDETERRTVKRSRFDQTEPEPKRTSRFDRRSRSPPSRRSEPGRDRSPIAKDATPEARKSPTDAAAAAAAAAARINAQLQARKGIQHVDVPPIRSADTDSPPPRPTSTPQSANKTAPALDGEMYVADGDYIQDIEVNDLRNRYLLTKGSTQKMIKDETGADITTRGSYYPNKSMATAANPPLYLHITSTSKSGLEAAVAKINELIQQELPQLVDERRFRRRDQEQVERDEFGRRKWPEEKIPISLEPVHGFNLRAQVVGHGGAYVKHIQQETTCRVQIKGRGSGYLEAATNQESDEDMFLHVTGPDPNMVAKAKELCEDLIANVKEQYEEFKSRPPRYGGDRYGGDRYGGDRYNGGGDRNHSHGGSHGASHGSYGGSGYGGYGSNQGGASNSPATAGVNSPTNAADYAAQYAQYYGGADPYAAYGGYANYVAMYQQYYGAQAQAQAPGAPGATPGQSVSPPPPPPSEAAPPPPPPSSAPPPPPPSGSPPGTGGSYGSVPPPPEKRAAGYGIPWLSASNPSPFLLSPAVNLPVSFGSAYVGETFSCTLCANNELPTDAAKNIRDVRIEAEMKTPGMGAVQRLELGPSNGHPEVDLESGGTLQKVVSFDLKEEGNHVLAVTVSYYEATETSGRTRTFRKLYQFICKASLIVRTKVGPLNSNNTQRHGRWVLEAQLENCSEDVVQLEKVVLDTEPGLRYRDCNWEASGSEKPVLHPGEVEQVCFVVAEDGTESGVEVTPDGRIIFGSLGIGWRGTRRAAAR
ncbi:MSL5-like protein [Fusarium sp. NRRL 52700]|nr:MSL5-like protein [Fusarium sp. NRRL 52700]